MRLRFSHLSSPKEASPLWCVFLIYHETTKYYIFSHARDLTCNTWILFYCTISHLNLGRSTYRTSSPILGIIRVSNFFFDSYHLTLAYTPSLARPLGKQFWTILPRILISIGEYRCFDLEERKSKVLVYFV